MAIGQLLDDNGNPIYYDEDETPWIPPNAVFDPNTPAGQINLQNPTADPNKPFVQAGNNGYIDGIGETIAAGSSITPAQRDAYVASAVAAGVPEGWIGNFIARNPNDYNRIEEGYFSDANQEDTRTGAPNVTGGGGGGGGGGNQGAFAPPPNAIGWMPTLDLPTWTPPAPFQAPPAFSYDELSAYPEYQKPADYVPGTFSAPTIEEARQEPGFQFALDEGRRQMEASAAAKGIGRTGGTVKRLIGYGQEMADTNYGNVFNRNLGTFNTNEGNRAGANTTNAALGFGAWDANRQNAANTWAANYGLAKDKYGLDYGAAKDTWQTGYDSSRQKHDYDTAEAVGEYAPKKTEAELTHAQAFAEWLAKMGIAKDIFAEGSD